MLDFKKKAYMFTIVLVAFVAILSVGFAVNRIGGSLPFKDLNTSEIAFINLYCIPPDVSIVIDDRKAIEEISAILQTIVEFEKDDTGREYDGQLVQFTLTMLSGEIIQVGVSNPFIIIDGQHYRTKYEPCEELNRIGNLLLDDKKFPYKTARAIVETHYPNASDIISSGEDVINYTNPPAAVDVFTFEVVMLDETIICAVSKEQGIFFTYSEGKWYAFTGLQNIDTSNHAYNARPIITLYGFDANTDNGEVDEVKKHFTQRLQPEKDTGWTLLTDTVFIDVFVPDGTIKVQTYYAESGSEVTAHIMLDNKYSAPHKNPPVDTNHPTGNTWRVTDYFPNGFLGHIWAVTIDANGVEHTSAIIPVIYPRPGYDVNGNPITDITNTGVKMIIQNAT